MGKACPSLHKTSKAVIVPLPRNLHRNLLRKPSGNGSRVNTTFSEMLNKHLIDFSTHVGLLLENVTNSLWDIQLRFFTLMESTRSSDAALGDAGGLGTL